MSDTIDNFKDFYKPTGEAVDFPARQAYDKVLDIIGYDLKHKNITITCTAEEEITLHGNPNEFAQVLLNLIGNARDALMEREVSNARIDLHASRDGDYACITIQDNAGGIPETILEKIFKPYFSTKADKGTGIGLYMVQTILHERFKGSIEATNGAEGALFTLRIAIHP